MAERLAAAGVERPVVATERVAAIERTPGGRPRLVVPQAPRSPTLA